MPQELVRPVLPGLSFSPARRRWLLLPGWGQTGAHWTVVARWLASAEIELVCADLSAVAAACPAPAGSVARLEQMAELLRPEAAAAECLVGHSAGTVPAVLLAAGVAGAVLVEPVPAHFGLGGVRGRGPAVDLVGDGEEASALERLRRLHPMASAATLGAISRALAAGEPGGPRTPQAVRTAGAGLARTRSEAAACALAALDVPFLVVRGQASTMLTDADAEALSTGGLRPQVVAQAGHSPHIDRPRETAAVLTGFAQGWEPTPG